MLAPEILVMPGALRDTLTAHGAPELTAVYCQGDDILFEALPPSITWDRTMTMGRGGERSDFRWCRRDNGEC